MTRAAREARHLGPPAVTRRGDILRIKFLSRKTEAQDIEPPAGEGTR